MPRSHARPALVPCLLAAACQVGPAWTPDERRALDDLQRAVCEQLRTPAAALETDGVRTLPASRPQRHVDTRLNAFPALGRHDAPGELQEGWSMGSGPLEAMLFRDDRDTTLAVADRTLAGFDALHAFATHPDRGAVIVATRRGEQTVATKDHVWCGELWHPSYRPELSVDGSCFTYVASHWWRNRAMLARTDDPTHATRLELPGVVHWPVWPGRDGSHLWYVTTVGGRVEVHDGDRIVATADRCAHVSYDEHRDHLTAHLEIDGKTRLLRGDRLTPPLDSYRWIDGSSDDQHMLAAGRDGDEEAIVFDDRIVLRCRRLAWMDLCDDGSTWAIAYHEGDQSWIVRPDGKTGPFAPIEHLALAADGQSLAVETRVGRTWTWTLDGTPLGAGYRSVRDVRPLRARGGAVFVGSDDGGTWLVTPSGRDGPWDAIERCHVATDERHVMLLARRGDEWHRHLVPLR